MDSWDKQNTPYSQVMHDFFYFRLERLGMEYLCPVKLYRKKKKKKKKEYQMNFDTFYSSF